MVVTLLRSMAKALLRSSHLSMCLGTRPILWIDLVGLS